MFLKASSLALIFLAGLSLSVTANDDRPRISTEDFAPLLDNHWIGTLTYLDYQPPYSQVSLDVSLTVELAEEQIQFFFDYPREPNANNVTTLEIKEGGYMLGQQRVIRKSFAETIGTKFSTQFPCNDNGVKAQCTIDYTIGETMFSFSKTVEIKGQPSFVRNAYHFVKQGSNHRDTDNASTQ